MKRIFLPAFLSFGVICAFAQGTVSFRNTPSTLVSVFGDGLIQPPPGTYFFALLIAPSGTTTPTDFSFSGLYATNTSSAGMLNGSSSPLPPGTTIAFEVAGWDASLGPSFNSSWLSNWQAQPGFGLSMIAEGAPGTPSQPLPIFGPSTISQGFYILPIPEPAAASLVILGGIFMGAWGRNNPTRRCRGIF